MKIFLFTLLTSLVLVMGCTWIFGNVPSNCQDVTDLIFEENSSEMLKLELIEAVTEEPDNMVCLAEGIDLVGDTTKYWLYYDGEFINTTVYLPSNCIDLAEESIGKEITNTFGARWEIFTMEITKVISEEPNNIVCLAEGMTSRGEEKFQLSFDGSFFSWKILD